MNNVSRSTSSSSAFLIQYESLGLFWRGIISEVNITSKRFGLNFAEAQTWGSLISGFEGVLLGNACFLALLCEIRHLATCLLNILNNKYLSFASHFVINRNFCIYTEVN